MFEKGHKKLGGRKIGLVIPKHNYNWVYRDQIFIGSLAAAKQVSRIGNIPLVYDDLERALNDML